MVETLVVKNYAHFSSFPHLLLWDWLPITEKLQMCLNQNIIYFVNGLFSAGPENKF